MFGFVLAAKRSSIGLFWIC